MKFLKSVGTALRGLASHQIMTHVLQIYIHTDRPTKQQWMHVAVVAAEITGAVEVAGGGCGCCC